MNFELTWFAVPISGILWALGGTFNKAYRRIGVPVLLAAQVIIFIGFTWWVVGILAGYLAALRLPFTLKGDSIHDSAINWDWIWISGALLGVPALFLGLATGNLKEAAVVGTVPMIVQGILGTLSNLKTFREIIVWKLVEISVGMAVAFPIAHLIQQSIRVLN